MTSDNLSFVIIPLNCPWNSWRHQELFETAKLYGRYNLVENQFQMPLEHICNHAVQSGSLRGISVGSQERMVMIGNYY